MTLEQCPVCDGRASVVREFVDFAIGNRSATVKVERFACDVCGERFYTPSQAEVAQIAAADEMRKQEGLLTPSQIKAVRRRYNLTQAQFEQLLASGPKTVVRWERGTVFQSRATDLLIRGVDASSQFFEFLASRAGLDVSRDTETGSPQARTFGAPERVRQSAEVVDISDFKVSPKKVVRKEAEAVVPDIPMKEMK